MRAGIDLIHVPFRERLEIGAQDFSDLDVEGKAVLVHTGWSVHWNTPAYFEIRSELMSWAMARNATFSSVPPLGV